MVTIILLKIPPFSTTTESAVSDTCKSVYSLNWIASSSYPQVSNSCWEVVVASKNKNISLVSIPNVLQVSANIDATWATDSIPATTYLFSFFCKKS